MRASRCRWVLLTPIVTPPHICGGMGAVEGHTRDNKDLVGTMGIS